MKKFLNYLLAISILLLVGLLTSDILLFYLKDYQNVIIKVLEIVLAVVSSASLSVKIAIDINSGDIKNKNVNNNDSNITNISITGCGSHQIVVGNNEELKKEIETLKQDLNSLKNYNVNSALSKAIEKIGDNVIKPIDKDFLLKYISDSAYVSNEEVREVWSSLLAYEARTENGISKRTLDIVKNMSPSEAKIFEKLAVIACIDGTIVNYKLDEALPFIERSTMKDIGLLKGESHLVQELRFTTATNRVLITASEGYALIAKSTKKEAHIVNIPCEALTKEGLEIKNAIGKDMSLKRMVKLGLFLRKEHKNDSVEIRIEQILVVEEDNYRTATIDLIDSLATHFGLTE